MFLSVAAHDGLMLCEKRVKFQIKLVSKGHGVVSVKDFTCTISIILYHQQTLVPFLSIFHKFSLVLLPMFLLIVLLRTHWCLQPSWMKWD